MTPILTWRKCDTFKRARFRFRCERFILLSSILLAFRYDAELVGQRSVLWVVIEVFQSADSKRGEERVPLRDITGQDTLNSNN